MLNITLHKEGLTPPDSDSVLKADCLVLAVSKGSVAKPALMKGCLTELNHISNGEVRRIFELGDYRAALGETLLLPSLPGFEKRVLFFGLGDGAVNEQSYDKALRAMFKRLSTTKIRQIILSLNDVSVTGRDTAWHLQHMAMCAEFANYRYTATCTNKEKQSPFMTLKQIDVLTVENNAKHQRAIQRGIAIASGMCTARDLGDLPANICTPAYLARRVETLSKELPVLKAEILNEKKIRNLKMHALLSVSKGSVEEPYVAILEYSGASKDTKPIVLVGKGVCFDTGGISIKPSSAMDEMKYDMCGAGTVIGTLEAVARLELPLNVVGVVGAVENMPSDRATKPGDVVTSMSGKTIEVLNTDAEGRMVLCDLLHYVKKYNPKYIIDIATLTGACVVALGKHAAGLYSNTQDLADRLLESGVDTTDRAWQLPLWPEYKKELSSNFADIANIGGRYAGSISAACFLYEFVGAQWAWAHLDIAGVAWHSGPQKGGTGRPVALLSQFLISCS